MPVVVPETVRVSATNFRLAGDRGLAQGWKARAADNIAVVRLLQTLEREDRAATRDEQVLLARFTGFGASELANALFPVPGQDVRLGWEQISRDLNAATSDAERVGLMRATQYAHYTPEYIVRAMWTALTGMGFTGGHVLEPGCGTGLFLALMPEKAAAKASITAIEMDPITARIAGKLFPDAWVRAEDFTKARIAERFELAIGNPPFSDRTVRSEDSAGRLGLSLHDYFIARSVERLKPGGIGAFVTSRWTMDKTATTARAHIAEMADLVGAVRLPQAAMLADAGTEVVVDVLVFRKRLAGEESRGTDWLDVREVPETDEGEGLLSVNGYFLDHPEMVLGRHAWTSSQFGSTYTCRGTDGQDLPAALARALEVATSGIRLPEAVTADRAKSPRIIPGTVADGATIREGSYLLLGTELHQVVDGVPAPVPVKSKAQKEGLFDKHARIIRALIPIRNAVRAVLRAQEANELWGADQTRLRAAYHQFTRQFGPINRTITTIREVEVKVRKRAATGSEETVEADVGNEIEAVQAADEADRLDQAAEQEGEQEEEGGNAVPAMPVFREQETQRRPNLQPFMDDPDVWLVSSIEEYDEQTDTGRPGPVFSERVIHPPVELLITSAADALAVALHETGVVDLARIGELLGRSRADVLAELGEAVFLDPELTTEEHEAWITADAALSGAVRTKLARAEAAAALDARYARNVTALRLVQPEDLRPSDITARLGAPWIPTEHVEAFTTEVIGVTSRVMHCGDLMAMYRSFADVVLKDELRQHVRLPGITGGKRQIVAAPASKAFKGYQKILARRIKVIEQRRGPPQKGQDILLSVITDGRHAAIDLRFVCREAANEDGNKLNALIANAHRLYVETAERSYTDPKTGRAYPVRGGAQMIFSDLGTQAAMRTRGFSAYAWIRSELIRLGVPAAEIAFMQDYKKSAAKQRLFQSVNEGRMCQPSFVVRREVARPESGQR